MLGTLVTDVLGPGPFGSCCSRSRPIWTRASLSHAEASTVFSDATAKSVLTMSVPLAECETLMTGWVWTPLGEFHRCMLYCRVRLFAWLRLKSTLPKPTLLVPERGAMPLRPA